MKDFPSNDPENEFVKDYSIYNHKDLFMVATGSHKHCNMNWFLCVTNSVRSQHMDSFFEAKPDWSLNTHGGGNICTDLIAAKLNKRRNFHNRYQQLLQGIQEKIENHQMNPDSRQLLSLCYETIR